MQGPQILDTSIFSSQFFLRTKQEKYVPSRLIFFPSLSFLPKLIPPTKPSVIDYFNQILFSRVNAENHFALTFSFLYWQPKLNDGELHLHINGLNFRTSSLWPKPLCLMSALGLLPHFWVWRHLGPQLLMMKPSAYCPLFSILISIIQILFNKDRCVTYGARVSFFM